MKFLSPNPFTRLALTANLCYLGNIQGKTLFYSMQYKNLLKYKQAWLLLTFFICLQNQLSSTYPIFIYLRVLMFKQTKWFIKSWFNRFNRQKTNSYSFQQLLPQNLSWFLSSHMKMLCPRGYILKPTERAYKFFLKTVLKILKIALRWNDHHVFMWQLVEVLNIFSTLTLKHIFSKTKDFLRKLEYRF